MRKIAPHLLLTLAVSLAACSAYDRELLGDPAPEPVAQTVAEAPLDEGYATADVPDSLEMFDDLASYGSWYQLDPFGMVWRPNVGMAWQPMQDGYWAYTAYGWMWMPQDPFGWATYHYGYWVNDFTLGWVWIPGYQWSACQCDWIVMGDYVCWAPVPPPGYYYRDPWNGGEDYWMVVPAAKFRETEVSRYRATPSKFKSAYKNADVSRSAPEPRYVERITRTDLETVPVELRTESYGPRELTRVVVPGAKNGLGGFTPQPPPSLGSPTTTGGASTGGTSASSPRPSAEPRKEPAPRKFKSKDPDSRDSGETKAKSDGKKDGSKGGGSSKGKPKG